jgi:hypothetical protein
MLQNFVGIVDAQLLKAVVFEALKAENIKNTWIEDKNSCSTITQITITLGVTWPERKHTLTDEGRD